MDEGDEVAIGGAEAPAAVTTERLPDLFLVGAAKSGTTSMWHYLGQHPDIFLAAEKEPRYFAWPDQPPPFTGPHDAYLYDNRFHHRADYLDLYRDAAPGQRVADFSMVYFEVPGTAARIAEAVPDARILVLLRHPVARAWSQWKMGRSLQVEDLGFAEALAAEDRRLADGWSPMYAYRGVSSYSGPLQEYLDTFGTDRVTVVRHDDLEADPTTVVAGVFASLGLAPAPVDAATRHNLFDDVPKDNALDRLTSSGHPLRRMAKKVVPRGVRGKVNDAVRRRNTHAPELDPAVGARLAAELAPDVAKVEAITGWDLADWKRWPTA